MSIPKVSRPGGAQLVAGPVIAAVMLFAGAATADAHDPAAWYSTGRWPGNVNTNEPYYLATGVPFVARVEASIVFGANQWNNVGEPVRFAHQGWSNNSIIQFPNCPGNTHSYVFQRDIGSNLAETYNCPGGGPFVSFVMTFDQISWHSDSTPPPPTAYDRRSTASHEFGHATGGWTISHWPDTSTRCQVNAQRLTMCRAVPQGTDMMRSLGDHDIHTFQAAYPY
jgi:hypothetical protein